MISENFLNNEEEHNESVSFCDFLDTKPEKEFDDITALVSYTFKSPIAFICLFDSDLKWIKSRIGLKDIDFETAITICSYTFSSKDVTIVSDLVSDERFSKNILGDHFNNFKFYAGAPIIKLDGSVAGVIGTIDYVSRTIDDSQINALKTLSQNIATLLELRFSFKKRQIQIEKIKNTELELLESNTKIRDFSRAIDENSIMVFTDPKGVITKANKLFCQISKYPEEELIGKTHKIVNSDFHSTEFFKEMWVTINSKNVWKGEIRNKAKDGTFYWVDTTIVPFINLKGEIYQFLAIRKDITKHKSIESALIKSEEQYRSLVENSPDFIVNINLENIIIYSNRTTKRFSKDQIIGSNVLDFFPAINQSIVLEKHREAIKSKKIQTYETKYLNQSGILKWSFTHVIPLISEMEVIGLTLITRDISESKKLEQMLIEKNDFIEKVTDSIPGMIGYWTKDLRNAFANSAYKEWFGLDKEKILGMRMQDVLGEAVFRKNEIYINGALRGEPQRFERKLTKANGKDGYTWAQYIPDIANGIVKGFLVLVTDITELKLTEISLLESKIKLNEILESMPEGVVEIDLQGEIIYANRGASKILDIQKSNIEGKYFNSREWNQLDENGNPYPVDQLPLALALKTGHEVGPIVHLIENESGEQKWLSVHATPLFDKDKNLYGAIASFSDITKRILDEKVIIENETFMKAIVSSLDDIIFLINEKYIFLNVWTNRPDLLLIPKENFIDRTIRESLGDEFAIPFEKMIDSVIESKQKLSHDYQTSDGEWFRANINYVVNDPGKGHLVSFFIHRITETKKIQQELIKSKERYSSSLDNMVQGCQLIGFDFTYLYVNNTAAKQGMRTRAELEGKTMMEMCPGIENTNLFKSIQSCMKERKSVRIENQFQFPDGSPGWFDLSIEPSPEGVFIVSTDITERKKTEIEILNAKQEAEFANKAKSDFLTNISHEIRTPMNAILGFAELLSSKVEDETLAQYVLSIMTSGKILLKLINDVLDLSKIESGKIEIQNTVTNLKKTIEEIQIIFSQKLIEKNLSMKIEINKDLPEFLYLDEMRLRQVLLNLVGNAIKFTEKGSISVEVDFSKSSTYSDSIDLEIKVSDTGIGIEKENLERIFDAFTQTTGQDQSKYGGTGLGLTIAKRIITLMGGEISVISKPNIGTVFTLKLNQIIITLKKDNKFEDEINSTNNNLDIEFEPAKILLVDDVSMNRDLVIQFLKKYPTLEIIVAENGKIAIELANKHKPDIILMDIKMPVMNGLEATKILKRLKNTSSIPVIALTASAFEQTKREITNISNGYLQKPVSRKELVNKLSEFIKYRPIKRENAENKLEEETIEITSEQKLKLFNLLKKEKLEQIDNLLEVIDFSECMRISEEVISLGQEFNYRPLVNWGRAFKKNTELFDTEKINILLKEFRNLVDSLN